jgi:hypothetical protein
MAAALKFPIIDHLDTKNDMIEIIEQYLESRGYKFIVSPPSAKKEDSNFLFEITMPNSDLFFFLWQGRYNIFTEKGTLFGSKLSEAKTKLIVSNELCYIDSLEVDVTDLSLAEILIEIDKLYGRLYKVV